jgi:hypothetical protein
VGSRVLLWVWAMAIGIVGDVGVRANAQQSKLFVGMLDLCGRTWTLWPYSCGNVIFLHRR